MLVTATNFDDALKILSKEKVLSFDTETTTLHWWDSIPHNTAGFQPRIFAMQFATRTQEFYFDFNELRGLLGGLLFSTLEKELFSDPDRYWFIANAKFDLHQCSNYGISFKGTVHCTKAIARLCNNLEPSLSLDALSEKYLGAKKIPLEDIPKSRIKKFGFNDKYEDVLHFDRLPLSTLVEYGKRDVRLCYDLGMWQLAKIKQIDDLIAPKKLSTVLENENKLTKILFEMENRGVKIDQAYTEKAYENEVEEYSKVGRDLDQFAGHRVDWLSPKQLKLIFDKAGEPYSFTEKGNASFDREALEASESHLAKSILKYRYHYKRAHSYFENFLWMSDSQGILHCDNQPAGTQTGRMSVWNPALQTVPKRRDKEEANFKVRKCFVPRPGFFFADIDYTAAEYYLMLDYAKEMTLIEKVKQGEDIHEATKKELGLRTRDEAKTMNFGLIYGMGYEKFAKALHCTVQEAKLRKQDYFRKLPEITTFINNVKSVARTRGYVTNWLGRVLQFDTGTDYKAPNALIQGGVGDMCKVAMTEPHPAESHMLLQVHDSLLFEVENGAQSKVLELQSIMERAYPAKLLPMKTEAQVSKTSWAELDDVLPL